MAGKLQRAYSVAAMRALARRRLPRVVFDFCDGGAEDEITRERNESAFADLEFLPQPLNGTSGRDLSIELFGERLAMPLLIGPTGLSGMLWPRGEAAIEKSKLLSGPAPIHPTPATDGESALCLYNSMTTMPAVPAMSHADAPSSPS